MNKLLKLLDNNILKYGVALAILFTALYPKLPSIHVPQTWVYIRLEDFLILALSLIWFIQLLRKKVSLPRPEGYALVGYWVVGLISLVYCLLFIAPELINFYPKIAFLQYARRIEYMILFFIAFSTIKNVKDVYFYLITLCITIFGIILYGFGQRFYLLLWNAFPDFFQKYPFCFPAFLTGNEEFAKGTPLCLNETSRITSTFGGHYDLSAYLVFFIPVLLGLVFTVKRVSLKILLALLGILSLELLNFTSSRTSFGAYVVGIVGMLVLWQKKKWIVPILVISIGVMLLFDDATIQRFSKTIQEVQVVSVDKELPEDLKKIIADAKTAEDIKKPEVPPASDFTVGSKPLASSSAGFTTVLTQDQLARLQDQDLAISSISGGFLIKKAYALDVSFTTRFQAEWPRNWNAFLSSPIFGTGYSSLTLATDNDYLRALGETGLAGTLAFFFIFVIFGIYMKHVIPLVKNKIVEGVLFGLSGGMIGLLVNAVLIDVFEASKVAEPMWIFLGIGIGAGGLFMTKKVNYKNELLKFFTSPVLIVLYLLLLIVVAFGGSIANFFVADDFTWLRWAASTSAGDLLKYFYSSQDFFYRPLDKIIVYYLYLVFSFQPEGYHIFTLLLHFLSTLGVYFLATKVLKNKLLGFFSAVLFALHPSHTENLFWFSTLSANLSTIFIVYSLITFYYFREKKKKIFYILSLLLIICAFLSYEISVIAPLLLVLMDLVFFKLKLRKETILTYLPFVALLIGYFILRYASHSFSGGGDYSYNFVKIVPNTLGNLMGYLGIFLGGIPFLPLYDSIRGTLRAQWLLMSIISLIVLALGGLALYKNKKVFTLWNVYEVKVILFGIFFAFISLLPFLPLGNIATRYLYTASVGLIISFIMIIFLIITQLIKDKKLQIIILWLCMFVLSIWYWTQNTVEMQKWQNAGAITKQTLMTFRTKYASFTPETKLYFVNLPVQSNGVWVFPVGLVDGLWFIYRENTPQVYDRASLEEGKEAKRLAPINTYIFQFKPDGVVEIK